jgi:hypothetical protein
VIDSDIVREVDEHLDAGTGKPYRDQPLAQDWARVAKVTEEAGEAIAELILWTGQNPRKPLDPAARARLLKELADVAMTGVYAIQHFTKDAEVTSAVLAEAQARHLGRLRELAGV